MRGFVLFVSNGKGNVYKKGKTYQLNANIAQGYVERGYGHIAGQEVEEKEVEEKKFNNKKHKKQ